MLGYEAVPGAFSNGKSIYVSRTYPAMPFVSFYVGQGEHCIKNWDKDYAEGRKYHPYYRRKSLRHCDDSKLGTMRFDPLFVPLDTVSEYDLYNENSLLPEIMGVSPYNMQSSMQVTVHLRAKRVVRADLQALGMERYDDLVEQIE